jgi:hypothetical protein
MMNCSFRLTHNSSVKHESAAFRHYSDPYLHSYHQDDRGDFLPSASSIGMIIRRSNFSRMSSFEDRNSKDVDKTSEPSRPQAQYQSTREGDVVVVEPSFDAEDGDRRGPVADEKSRGERSARASPSQDEDGQSKRGHSRKLSEHFYDATTLSGEQTTVGGSRVYAGYRGPPPEASPVIGQKHGRAFSGEVTNPPEAHRRINSIGKSSAVQRRPYIQERQHQRVDSAGLDILTAAADVSREELAAAAGERAGRTQWDSARTGARRSPVQMVSYDHSSVAPPPPPLSSRGHPRGYSAGPPPPSYYAPHGYPQPPYPPPSFYGHPPPTGFQRTMPGAPPGGYPVQYARGADPYAKSAAQGPLHQPSLEQPRDEVPPKGTTPPKRYTDRGVGSSAPPGKAAMTPPPPVAPSHWRGGSTQGVQTYVTSIGVGEGNRTLQATAPNQTSSEYTGAIDSHHHRKTSSISSWAPPMSLFMGPPADFGEHPLKGHHRATSSSVSFMGLDVGGLDNTDATFLKNLQASTGTAAPAFTSNKPMAKAERDQPDSDSVDSDGKSKLAPGGTSKRVRRKCNISGCENRVVQGGLCIAHGAKRKLCKHPGCDKNVKKAGLCSTHGPARRRCDAEGCSKVAVQGGRCIAHGAKKKLCAWDGCAKQAILGGMCKKHHDQTRKDSEVPPPGANKTSKRVHKPTHTRGLSLFQEMSAEVVGNILGDDPAEAPAPTSTGTQHRHQSTFSRDFSNLY